MLVNRGFLPTPDAVTAQTDSVRELGRVQVKGTALRSHLGAAAPLDAGRTTPPGPGWTGRPSAARLPYSIAPVYIRQTPDSALPRFPRRLEPLPIDDGPHLSYAIQWFSFAVMAVCSGW